MDLQKLQNNFQFTSYMVNNNSMAQSVQDQYPHLAQSQIINQANVNRPNHLPYQQESNSFGANYQPHIKGDSSKYHDEQYVQQSYKNNHQNYNQFDIHDNSQHQNHGKAFHNVFTNVIHKKNNSNNHEYNHQNTDEHYQSQQQNDQYHSHSQIISQRKSSSHSKQPHFKLQLTQKSILSPQTKNINQKLKNNLFIQKQQNSRLTKNHVQQNNTLQSSRQCNNKSRKQSQNSNREDLLNEEISQVKYRLDELMKRFPINNNSNAKYTIRNDHIIENNSNRVQNTTHNEVNFKKKQHVVFCQPQQSQNQPLKVSNHSHPMRRSRSIDQQPIPINHQMNQYSYTQSKIPISSPIINRSQHKREKNSLIYSQSQQQQYQQYYHLKIQSRDNINTKQNNNKYQNENQIQITMSDPKVQLLWKQVQQQQQIITNYKDVIYRLQNQNNHLVNMINQYNLSYYNSNNNNSVSSKQQQHQYIQHQQTINSEQFHKFERQYSPQQSRRLQQQQSQHQPSHNHIKLPTQSQSYHQQTNLLNTSSQQLPKPTSSSNNKIRISGKINLSLQQQVQILQQQKKQLLQKIDWLNNMVEEMMNMGQEANNNLLLTKKHSSNNNFSNQSSGNNINNVNKSSSHSKQVSRQLNNMKQSRVVQTSFIINQPRQKQQSILYNQSLKQQLQQLSQLQNAYNHQFDLILKQIKQIKQNRSYYDKLKKEIKKERSKSRNKQFGESITMNRMNGQNINNKRIFENYLVYQMKKENQRLRLQIQQLRQENQLLKSGNYQFHNYQSRLLQQQPIQPLIFQAQLSNLSNYTPSLASSINNSHQRNNSNQLQSKNQINEKERFNKNKEKQRYLYQNKSKISSASNRKDKQRQKRSTDQQDNKRRPQSYGQFYFNTNKQSSSLDSKYNLTSILNINENRKYPHLSSHIIQSINHNNNYSQLSPTMRYNNKLLSTKKQYLQDQHRKSQIDNKYSNNNHNNINNSSKRISTKNRLQDKTIITRYNNFIKNMKQKFGINSTIIGSQLGSTSNELE